jgi:hypothetical protein
MATRKKAATPEEQPQAPKEAGGEELLQKTAKAIGAALGKAAVKTGLAHPEPAAPKKSGKLAKSGKKRLPRKLKKQEKKKLASR